MKNIIHNPIMQRARRFRGQAIPASPLEGTTAIVTPGQTVSLEYAERLPGHPLCERVYRRIFHVGDTVVYDSYNLTYLGTIEAISANTVSVREDGGGRLHRMDLASFATRNRKLDLEKIRRRNAEWTD